MSKQKTARQKTAQRKTVQQKPAQTGKARALRPETMTRIAEFRLDPDNADFTHEEVALQFGVTVSQVRYAVQQFESGKIGSNDARAEQAMRRKAKELAANNTTAELLRDLIHETVAEITAAAKLDPAERVIFIEKASRAAKLLLDADLTVQIKNPDAERVAIMLRLINPKLTNQQIIELWKKADEIYRDRD